MTKKYISNTVATDSFNEIFLGEMVKLFSIFWLKTAKETKKKKIPKLVARWIQL